MWWRVGIAVWLKLAAPPGKAVPVLHPFHAQQHTQANSTWHPLYGAQLCCAAEMTADGCSLRMTCAVSWLLASTLVLFALATAPSHMPHKVIYILTCVCCVARLLLCLLLPGWRGARGCWRLHPR